MTDDELLAGILRKFLAGEGGQYAFWCRPPRFAGRHRGDPYMTLDGSVYLTEEEFAAVERLGLTTFWDKNQ
jgi:hypothetical protein